MRQEYAEMRERHRKGQYTFYERHEERIWNVISMAIGVVVMIVMLLVLTGCENPRFTQIQAEIKERRKVEELQVQAEAGSYFHWCEQIGLNPQDKDVFLFWYDKVRVDYMETVRKEDTLR